MHALTAALDAGEAVVLATVIDTNRSVPRHAGSKMLVFDAGRTIGTIGGGELESRVIREAQQALRSGAPRLVEYDLVDPERGDPGVCGGTVRLYLEPHLPTPTVFIAGCGHVGRAVVELAHWLGFRVVAYDDRADQVAADAIPLADVRLSGQLPDALAASPIGPNTDVVVVTRNVAIDLQLLPVLLAAQPRWIGVMGSKRRWAATRDKLRDGGVPEADLDRVVSPIGLELHAETPEEIAVSIMAQIVAARRGDSRPDDASDAVP